MKIGFLGCGKIAAPMIRSLCRQFPDSELFVSVRTEWISQTLSSEFSKVNVGDNQWVLDQSDIVILSVLAAVARAQFPCLKFRDDHQIISVMADIDLKEVGDLIHPAKNPCVTIPLPFIETGRCPLPVFPESKLLEYLYGDENIVLTLASEAEMGPHFAATAILSTLMAQLDCASKWLGSHSNNDLNGEIYVGSLVSGYLNSIERDGKQRFLEAMQDLSTKGGLNTQLLNHHKAAGLLETLAQGLNDLDRRLKGA